MKKNNQQLSVHKQLLQQLPIYNFGQQRLNSSTNWSAAKNGQVLPHFQQIVSAAWMMPRPIAAVI
jgi:hypothetical protein